MGEKILTSLTQKVLSGVVRNGICLLPLEFQFHGPCQIKDQIEANCSNFCLLAEPECPGNTLCSLYRESQVLRGLLEVKVGTEQEQESITTRASFLALPAFMQQHGT